MPRSSRRIVVLAAAGLTLLSLPGASGAAAFDWTDPGRVTEQRGSTLTSLHELASSGDVLHLVHGRLGPEARDDRLVVQRSRNGGRTWTDERSLFESTATHRALMPNQAVAAVGRLVVVAWRTRGPAGTSLWVRRSADGGTTWRRRRLLAETDRGRGLGVPALAIARGAVIAAWTDRSTGQVVVRRSPDAGETWNQPRTMRVTRLTIECDATVLDGLVALAGTGDVVHLAWSDSSSGGCIADRLYLRTSIDGGQNWGDRHTASTTRTYGWPELTARGRFLLASTQRPDGGLSLVRSSDTGATFTERRLRAAGDRVLGAADVLLPGSGRAWLVYPDLAYDGNDLAGSRVLVRASTDGGRTWSVPEVALPRSSRLRQAANLGGFEGDPIVVVASGPADASRTDIFVIRGR